jgi:TIR domain/Pentapeptide repeats (8 copies)
MANDEHVAMLKKGVKVWNKWRDENQSIQPDLRGANLAEANLAEANLRGANLAGAGLTKANLTRADLSGTSLFEANLTRANLTRASLTRADLLGAILSGANLSEVLLQAANLNGADLSGADLSGACLFLTVFADTALIKAKLDHCDHVGPSSVDFQTLEKSGPLPVAFLRGVGLPDRVMDYSCFIGYFSKDQAFAERLHADLQNKSVRCWFAPHDMRIGAKIIDAIDEAIRLRDKVLLILSEGAIASDWVEGEVTRALDEERTRKQVVLFPCA